MHDFAVRFATAASLAACSVVVLAAPVSAVDATGVWIELAAPAARIVSLAPHATELLFAAGAGGSVVGLLAPADWPPEAKRVPRVGDAAGLDLERVVALKPDLVVVWPYFAPGEVERLRALGVPVFVSDPRTPEAIADDLEGLGALAGTSETAARAATDFRTRLAALLQRSRAAAKVSVFYEIWPRPLYTVGGKHLITAALALCGGDNVFARLATPAATVGIEDVLAAQPQAILAAADDATRPVWLDDWRRWNAIPAVARGNLFVVDGNLLHRAGPRFIEGVEGLCAALDRARENLRR
ncbi:MAG: cobalamin-binding protein [Betaproteobacteria bacterium]|nr:MAG: cobalamin-binding protein [Betaproteobacteria bacterium]